MTITSIKSINSKQDLKNVLKRVDELWGVAEPNTPVGEELVIVRCSNLLYDYSYNAA
ncbi:hypothetical protein [Pseudoalteromonas fuliginea]|uniref:hypothetical protein n=1 Tax=Pseudoalteromonas fuliginea TaxID=1872678 RepID=UPI00316FEC54